MSAPELSPSERRQAKYFQDGEPAYESWHLQIERAISSSSAGHTLSIPTAAKAVAKLISGEQADKA